MWCTSRYFITSKQGSRPPRAQYSQYISLWILQIWNERHIFYICWVKFYLPNFSRFTELTHFFWFSLIDLPTCLRVEGSRSIFKQVSKTSTHDMRLNSTWWNKLIQNCASRQKRLPSNPEGGKNILFKTLGHVLSDAFGQMKFKLCLFGFPPVKSLDREGG